MNSLSLGDLAHSFLLRRQSVALNSDLTRLSQELASGRTSDTSVHLGGRFAALADFERELVLLGSHAQTAGDVRTQAGVMQTALETVNARAGDLAGTLALASAAGFSGGLESVTSQAKSQLESIIGALNTTVAGRAVFSGVAVDTAPLASANTLLTDLRTAISGATTAADILSAADDFFDLPGGGFETAIYQGDTVNLSPVDLGSGESVALSLRADDPALRDVMKQVALAALVNDPALSLSDANENALLTSLHDGLWSAKDDVTQLQANLGFAEERIEVASVRIGAERSTVELARNALLEVDPYRTATELEAVQSQLEMLYTITARSSRLSLVNFLS